MTGDRAAFTAALRELADFIDAHPDLPLPTPGLGAEMHPYLSGTDEEQHAEVDRIAAILDVSAILNGGTHYEAERLFGDWVSYRVVAIPSARMAQHNALMSYHDAVIP
jgi:hypothetical protein